MAANAKKVTSLAKKGQFKMADVDSLTIGANKSLALFATENDLNFGNNAEASWVKGCSYGKNAGAKAGFDMNLVSNSLIPVVKDISVGRLVNAVRGCFQLFRYELELGNWEDAQATWAKGVLYAKAIGKVCNFDLNMV